LGDKVNMKKIVFVMLVGMLLILPSLSAQKGEVNSLKTTSSKIKAPIYQKNIGTRSITDGRVIKILELINEMRKDGTIDKKEIEKLKTTVEELFEENSIYVNTMCKVTAIGGGLLLLPFLPVTPVLVAAGGILLDTDGANGHWSHIVQIAMFIPFIGVPLYILPPPLFIIGGYAGFALGIDVTEGS